MVDEVARKPLDLKWSDTMYRPKVGPLDAAAALGPIAYMAFAIFSLTVLICAVLWVAAFGILALFSLTPRSFYRAALGAVFGQQRPARTVARARTTWLGE